MSNLSRSLSASISTRNLQLITNTAQSQILGPHSAWCPTTPSPFSQTNPCQRAETKQPAPTAAGLNRAAHLSETRQLQHRGHGPRTPPRKGPRSVDSVVVPPRMPFVGDPVGGSEKRTGPGVGVLLGQVAIFHLLPEGFGTAATAGYDGQRTHVGQGEADVVECQHRHYKAELRVSAIVPETG